ncbi:hypothetical protein MEO93_27940 [Dolichospermum sp. ST_sed3]|nr:hypothetical protein [Dolichospermum sp. ST_sed3]
MKMAKISTILIVFVMAVFCLNGPFVLGGDEHPWDEEGGGGGLDGTTPDDGTLPSGGTGIGTSVTVSNTKTDYLVFTKLVKIAFVVSTIL